MSARSVLRHEAISYILHSLLDVVFLFVDNMTVDWMVSTVDVPASFPSVLVFAYPASLFLVATLFLHFLPCPTEYSPLHTVETASLLL
jgi:hypothetical protein